MSTRQFSTFYLGDRLYGIDVMQVQEVTKPMPVTAVRLAPIYVKGLINLRGQIATAIGLTELFKIDLNQTYRQTAEKMNVVCSSEGCLLSLLVDRIGDVVEVHESSFEPLPDTVEGAISRYMDGVYKSENRLLSVINIELISKSLNKTEN
jgi:purine-binding chemotaxis protein CheW